MLRYAGPAALLNRQWFDLLMGLLPLSVGNALGNGLNEPREDFIGTRVTAGSLLLEFALQPSFP